MRVSGIREQLRLPRIGSRFQLRRADLIVAEWCAGVNFRPHCTLAECCYLMTIAARLHAAPSSVLRLGAVVESRARKFHSHTGERVQSRRLRATVPRLRPPATNPVQRTVALKIIRPGMASEHIIARFEAERQVLAMMDHPNIACRKADERLGP